MLDRATNAVRGAISRLRGDGLPEDLLARGDRRLDTQTLRRLGLREQPFSDHTHPQSLFVDDAIRMQINVLASQLAEGDMLPVVKGEAGVGKTSVLIRLMTDHGEAMQFFVARGGPRLDARRIVVDMLRMLVRPVPDDPRECYRELARRLRGLVATGTPAVLVIDDADLMVDQELQHVLALRDGLNQALGGRFRSLLAGPPGLDTRLAALDSEHMRAGQMVTTDIRPFARPRVAPFVEHRLRTAGMSGELPLDEADFDRISSAAGGLPRAIETAAATALAARAGDHARS